MRRRRRVPTADDAARPEPHRHGCQPAGRRRLIAHEQVVGLAHALRHGVEHRDAGLELRLLRHVGRSHAGLASDQAVIRRGQPGHDLEQRGLARPVAANEANALAGFQRKIGVVEQGHVPESKLGIGNGKQGHGRKSGGGIAESGGAPATPGGGRRWRKTGRIVEHRRGPAPRSRAPGGPCKRKARKAGPRVSPRCPARRTQDLA